MHFGFRGVGYRDGLMVRDVDTYVWFRVAGLGFRVQGLGLGF